MYEYLISFLVVIILLSHQPGSPNPMQAPILGMRTTADPNATRHRTTREHLQRPYQVEKCDNLAYYCSKAYTTGRLCARNDMPRVDYHSGQNHTPRYQTFDTYCLMDYINCSEGMDVWKIAHLGACIVDKHYYITWIGQYYEYFDDAFLEQTYVIGE